jgi:hypothetical protein
MGETAKTGEPPEGEVEAVVVSTLPVLCVSHCRLAPEIAQARLAFESRDVHISVRMVRTMLRMGLTWYAISHVLEYLLLLLGLLRSLSGEHFLGLLLGFHAPASVVIKVRDTGMSVVDLQITVETAGPGVETDFSETPRRK